MNPYCWRADYGNSNWDIRHRVVATFVYDIPFFAVANPIVKAVFAQLAGERHRHRCNRACRSTSPPAPIPRIPLRAAPTGRTWFTRRPPTADAATWSAASTRPHSRSPTCIRPTPTTMRTATPAATSCADPARRASTSLCSRISRSGNGCKFQFRFETFDLFNHTNFGNPCSDDRIPHRVRNVLVRQHHRRQRRTATIQLGAKLLF